MSDIKLVRHRDPRKETGTNSYKQYIYIYMYVVSHNINKGNKNKVDNILNIFGTQWIGIQMNVHMFEWN